MYGVLNTIALLTLIVSLIALVRPLPTLKLPNRTRAVLTFFASIILISIASQFKPSPEPETPDKLPAETSRPVEKPAKKKVVKPDRTVTLAEFNRIREGMSYKQVVDIIGFKGNVMSESTMMGIRTVMYSWENDELFSIANMNAMFQNGKLVSKAQFGLK